MGIDERQLEVHAIIIALPEAIRYDKNAVIPGVTNREHKFWIAHNPAPGESRSMIEGTDFKPLVWIDNFIKLIRPKSKRKK